MTQHDELLVVRTAGAHPHVAQALTTCFVDLDAEQAGLVRVEPEAVPVRTPQQPADIGAAAGCRGEGRGHARRGVVGEQLVGVAPPVHEVEEVALPQGTDALVELGEVRRAVHDRSHVVALAPGHTRVATFVDAGVGVVPLLGAQEQVRDHTAILPVQIAK